MTTAREVRIKVATITGDAAAEATERKTQKARRHRLGGVAR